MRHVRIVPEEDLQSWGSSAHAGDGVVTAGPSACPWQELHLLPAHAAESRKQGCAHQLSAANTATAAVNYRQQIIPWDLATIIHGYPTTSQSLSWGPSSALLFPGCCWMGGTGDDSVHSEVFHFEAFILHGTGHPWPTPKSFLWGFQLFFVAEDISDHPPNLSASMGTLCEDIWLHWYVTAAKGKPASTADGCQDPKKSPYWGALSTHLLSHLISTTSIRKPTKY